MDPAAAATDTATALRSALDAAYRERQALSDRLDEVDQLIDDLSQAAESSAEAPTGSSANRASGRSRTTKSAARKATTKKTTRRSASKKASAKKAGAKKAGARKTSAKKAGAKKAGAKKASAKKAARGSASKATAKRTGKQTARKSTGSTRGSGDVGRTDRVVQLIAEADRPLTTGEVRSLLLQHEPAVTSKLVSASLSYAERKGRIRKSNDGRWVAATSSSASEPSGGTSARPGSPATSEASTGPGPLTSG